MTHRTLEKLFARFSSEGDLDALAEVFDRVAPDLERLARKLTPDRNRAADLVQATFLTALERPGTFEEGRALRPWLLGILVHRASADRRLAARPIEPDRLTQREVETPVAALDASEFRTAVSSAIGELPANLRVVLEGRLLEDKDAGALAEELAISRGALRVRLHRGLERLRSILPPSLATAFALVFMHSRGLAHVRSHVLKEAARVSTGKGLAVSAGVAGAVMVSKNAVLVVGVILLALLAGVLVEGDSEGEDLRTASLENAELGSVGVEEAPAEARVRVGDVAPPVAVVAKGPARVAIHVLQADGSPAVDFETQMSFVLGEERGTESLQTDEQGRVEFELAGGARLQSVEALATATTTPARENLWRPVVAGELIEVELTVTGGWPLIGRVLNREGLPVPNAEVRGWCDEYMSGEHVRKTRSNGNGEFRLEHLGPKFVATASAEGLVCSQGLQGELSSRVLAEGLTLEVAPAKSMHGVVLDPARVPIAGVELKVTNNLRMMSTNSHTHIADVTTFTAGFGLAVSDEQGRFDFTGLPFDSHTISVREAPYLSFNESRPTGNEPVEIVLDSGLLLSGRVTDQGGAPAAGAKVRFWPRAYSIAGDGERGAICDEHGRFSLHGITSQNGSGNRKYVLAVQHEGHAVHVIEQLKPSREGGEFVDVQLEREFVLAGRVLDEAGQPLSGVTVWAEGDREMDLDTSWMRRSTWEFCNGLDETVTDEEGRFRLDRLYDGEFTVHAISITDLNKSADVQTRSGNQQVEIALTQEAMRKVVLVGEVLDAVTREPIQSFTVTPYVRNSGRNHQFNSNDGRFELSGLTPGPIKFNVSCDGYRDFQIKKREYDLGEHEVHCLLSPARSLTLSVVDESGETFEHGQLEILDLTGERIHIGNGTFTSLSVGIQEGQVILHDLPAEQLTLRLKVGERAFGSTHEFPLDLSRPIEGVYELVVPRAVPISTVSLDCLVLVLGAEADETEIRRKIAESSNGSGKAWFDEAMKDGTLSFPDCKVVLTTSASNTQLSTASLELAEGGGFTMSMSQSTEYWGGRGESMSSQSLDPIPFPHLRLGRMPAAHVTLSVTSDCCHMAPLQVDLSQADAEGHIEFVLLRGR